jgi:hypothetical protein
LVQPKAIVTVMAAVRACALAGTMLLFIAGAAQADPPGPVTACASDTQLGAGLNLAQALAAGGAIRFQCPPGSTIRITGRYILKGNTVIDGGDAVTLDGQGAFGPMLSSSENVILRHLRVLGFAQRPPPKPAPPFISIGKLVFGSVLVAAGDAELDHVAIENSDFPIHVRRTATVRNSAFVGNRGNTLTVDGMAHIERSRFTGGGQALTISAGWVRSCDFNGQTAARGAVRVNPASGPVEILHSTFSGIRGGPALTLSQRAERGGSQTISVRANVFRDNDSGTAPGGAIAFFDEVQDARDRGLSGTVLDALAALPPAGFVLSYNRFTGNRGGTPPERIFRRFSAGPGGAIAAELAHTLGMVSTGDLFVGNVAGGDGGAIAVRGGALRMSHAFFKANQSGNRGAALAVEADGSATLSNALVVGNAGRDGAITGNAVSLVNVTIADNDAAGLLLETSAASVANVLLAHNRPADCARVPAGVFHGGALQSDGSCPGARVGEAFLDAFYVPALGSPALRAGDPAFCRGAEVGGVDLAFQARLDPAACTLGAFERPPLRNFSPKTDRPESHADLQDDFSDDDGYRPPPLSPGTPRPPAPASTPTCPPASNPRPPAPASTPTCPPASNPRPSSGHASTPTCPPSMYPGSKLRPSGHDSSPTCHMHPRCKPRPSGHASSPTCHMHPRCNPRPSCHASSPTCHLHPRCKPRPSGHASSRACSTVPPDTKRSRTGGSL